MDLHRRRFLRCLAFAGTAGIWPGFVMAESISDKVIFLRPGDRGYGDHTFLFNKSIQRRPAIVAVCFDEEGVCLAIERARKESLPVAIKSGGHSFEGFSLNDGGFVIDVSLMDAQHLSDDGIYTVEPSCRLMQTYEAIVPGGRLLPLGSCAMVGIAGLTLGGGYGIFSREHGLACDALRSLRIVDGQGKVHEISEGSELFRACRGGGNGNFGVVTQLRFETVTAPKQLWRYLFKVKNLDSHRATAVAKEWFDVAQQLPLSSFSAFVLNYKTLSILVTDTAEEASKALTAALARLEKIAEKKTARKEELLTGIRRYYGKFTPLYFKNASAGFYTGYGDIGAVAPELFSEVVSTPGLLYSIGTVGGAITDLDDGARTAYAHRQANFLGEIQSYWENPADEQRLRTAVSRFQKLLHNNDIHAHYCNYPDLGFKNWQSAYYGKGGYWRLAKVKQQYDPDNLFTYAQGVLA